MHDGGAVGQMGAQPHPVGIADANARRDHVVDHARDLVDRCHGDGLAARSCCSPQIVDAFGQHRPRAGPRTVRHQPEHAVEVGVVRPDLPTAQQVQPQVRICQIGRRRFEVVDRDGDRLADVDAEFDRQARPGRRRALRRPLREPRVQLGARGGVHIAVPDCNDAARVAHLRILPPQPPNPSLHFVHEASSLPTQHRRRDAQT